MSIHRAKVQGGRLVLDEPTALPEGSVLDLVVDDEGDDLDAEEREALHAAERFRARYPHSLFRPIIEDALRHIR